MSLATLEREILYAARRIFNNPKLRAKDIQEWSTSEVKKVDGEAVANTGAPLHVNIAVKMELDRRK